MKRANKIIALVTWAICALFLYLTINLKKSVITYEPGPRLIPYITIAAMAICALFIFIEKVDPEKEAKRANDPNLAPLGQIMIFFGIFLLGIILIKYCGFIIGAFIGIYGMMLLAMPKHWLRNLIISAVMVLVIAILFSYILKITLPRDPWNIENGIAILINGLRH